MKATIKTSVLTVLIATTGIAGQWSSNVLAAVDTKKSQEFFENAMVQLQKEELTSAVIELRNALQQNPQNLAARIKLGEILLAEDQPLSAIKELETAQSMGGDENLILVPLAKSYMKIAKPEQVITAIVSEGHEPEVDASLKIIQADAYMQLGSAREAEKLYIDASTLAPIDPRPILGLAKIEAQKGRTEKANKLLEQAVGLAPDSFDVLLFKALSHRDSGQYKLALDAFGQAIELFPGSVRALTGRAALWMDVGNYEKARADIETAGNLGRDSMETIYLRALLLFADGKEDEARESLTQSATEIRSIKDTYHAKLPNTRLMLGIVAFFEKSYDEAITHLDGFLKAIPKHMGARRYLASAYLAKQEWSSIKKLLTPRAGEQLLDPFALSILAEAHRATGDFRSAERYYATAMQLAPAVAGIGVRLAEARLDSGRPDKAVDELEELIERFPTMMEAHAQLARVYLKTGNKTKALESAKNLVDLFPDSARAHNVASALYLATGDRDKARNHLEQAALIDPELIQPTLNLARLARMEGHIDSAEAQYRATLARFPNALDAQLELCELLLQKGEIEELKTRLTQILTQTPRNIKAHDMDIKVHMLTGSEPAKLREKLFDFNQKFPKNPEVNLLVGKGYRALGDVEDAKVSFRHAVENALFDGEILRKVATQQMSIADLNGALWTLTKGKQASPDDLRIGILHAAVLSQLKDFARARDEIEKLFEAHGEKPEIHMVHGDYFMVQQDTQSAIEAYTKARDLAPTKKTTDVLLRAHREAGDFAGAERLIVPWIKKNPDDILARRQFSELLIEQNRWQDAKEILEGLQQDGIEDLLILNNLANVYGRLNDPRALPAAELIYERAPENAAVLDTYGWILTQNGRVEEGLAILREAYARASTQPAIRFHIGKALASLGRTDAAKEEVRAALEEGIGFADKGAAEALLNELEKN